MLLNDVGKIIMQEWEKKPQIRNNVKLGEFIIIPNHFHAILQIEYKINTSSDNIKKFQSHSQTIGSIIRGFNPNNALGFQ